MKFEHFCHLVRAAAAITGETEFVIIGSQAILGSWPDAPEDLLVSEEIDAWPRHRPELADLLDGTIGELSPFHETFGYYLQGVGPETATLAPGWEERLVRVSHPAMSGGVAFCLDPADLLAAKCAAGRDKDLRFVSSALRSRRLDPDVVLERIRLLEADDGVKDNALHLFMRASNP